MVFFFLSLPCHRKNQYFFNGSQSLTKNYHSILQNSNSSSKKETQATPKELFQDFLNTLACYFKKKKVFFRGKPLNVYCKKIVTCAIAAILLGYVGLYHTYFWALKINSLCKIIYLPMKKIPIHYISSSKQSGESPERSNSFLESTKDKWQRVLLIPQFPNESSLKLDFLSNKMQIYIIHGNTWISLK